MKKIMSFLINTILTMTLLFSITGCSSNQPSQNNSKADDEVKEDVNFSEIEFEDEEEVEISDSENTGGF